MSTAHANSPADLLRRLETMALMSDVDLPVEHVREQIASTIDLVVHLARFPDGRRVVSQVSSVDGLEGGRTVLRDVFEMRRGNEHRSPVPNGVPAAGVGELGSLAMGRPELVRGP
jgi:pilus assembly protein CpaF